ncbi:MAG: GNAT family N-acetyltransferase [Cyanobacteriota bacterium]
MDKSGLKKEINITYKVEKNLPIKQIQSLYKSINWKEKTKETLDEYLEKSIVVISAWHNNWLIGIARATTTSSKEVIIWDVAVRPQYQKMGIGSKIMKCMLTILDDYGVPVVTLYADPGTENFYEKFGFVPHKTRLLAMTRNI